MSVYTQVMNALLQEVASIAQPRTHQIDFELWERFYFEHFNLKVDLSHFLKPAFTDEFDLEVIDPRELTFQNLVRTIRSKSEDNQCFGIWLYAWSNSDHILEPTRCVDLYDQQREITLLRSQPNNNPQLERCSDLSSRVNLCEELGLKKGLTLRQLLITAYKMYVERKTLFGQSFDVLEPHNKGTQFLCNGVRYAESKTIPVAYWGSFDGKPELIISSLSVMRDNWRDVRVLETHP